MFSLLEFVPSEGENLTSWLERFGFYFSNLFENIFSRFRAAIALLNSWNDAYDEMFEHLFYLNGSFSISPDGTNFFSLAPYIANFRYFVGDLIFTEIYSLLMCGAAFFFFRLVFKIIEILKQLVGNVTDGSKPLSSLFNRFFG